MHCLFIGLVSPCPTHLLEPVLNLQREGATDDQIYESIEEFEFGHGYSQPTCILLRCHSEKMYSLWSEILATISTTYKIFIGEFRNRKKTTQAPLVYLNAHSCVYNKCLIVISRRDTIERRGAKKGKVWRTGLRQRWALGIPPTRRHPLNNQRRGSCRKVLGFRWSRCYKHSKRRTA